MSRVLQALGVLTAAFLFSGMVSNARADSSWWDSQSTANQQAIVNSFYESTGHAPPYPAEAARGGAIATALETNGADQTAPGTSAVASGQMEVVTSASLMPSVEKLGQSMVRKVAGRFVVIAIVASEVDLGLYVYAHLSTNEVGQDASFQYERIRYYPAGEEIYFGARSRGEWLFEGGGWNPIRWFESPCTFSGFSPPPGARLRTGVASTARCWYTFPSPPYGDYADVYVDYPYLTAQDIIATATLSRSSPGSRAYDYSVGGTPAPPGSVTIDLIGDYLDSPEGVPLRDEIIWILGEDGSDPATEPIRVPAPPNETPPPEDKRRWCERTPPGVTNVSIPFGVSEYDLWETFPSAIGSDAEMLVGSELLGAGSYAWRSLQGFGLRKIIAKHGWMSVDRDDTEAALMTSPVPEPAGTKFWDEYGRYTYYGDFYDFPDPSRVPTGTPGRCRRIVVVDTKAHVGEPQPRGIVTSFGAYVPNAGP